MNTLMLELKKVGANFRTYFGIAILWGLGVLIGINVWYNPSLVPLRQFGFQLSGLYVPGLTLYPLAVVGPVVTVLIAGESIAGERIKGTLRMVLAKPVTREQFYLGKVYLILVYAFFIVFSTLLVTAVLGLMLFGGGDVILPNELSNFGDGFFSVPAWEAAWRLVLCGIAVSLYILAFASVALFFSSFLNHSLASPVFTLVMTTAFTVLENLEFFSPLAPYLITHHFLYWQNFMVQQIDWSGFSSSLGVVMLYIAGGFFGGGVFFHFRDETD